MELGALRGRGTICHFPFVVEPARCLLLLKQPLDDPPSELCVPSTMYNLLRGILPEASWPFLSKRFLPTGEFPSRATHLMELGKCVDCSGDINLLACLWGRTA